MNAQVLFTQWIKGLGIRLGIIEWPKDWSTNSRGGPLSNTCTKVKGKHLAGLLVNVLTKTWVLVFLEKSQEIWGHS